MGGFGVTGWKFCSEAVSEGLFVFDPAVADADRGASCVTGVDSDGNCLGHRARYERSRPTHATGGRPQLVRLQHRCFPRTVYTWQPDTIYFRFASSFPPNLPYPARSCDRLDLELAACRLCVVPVTIVQSPDGASWFSVNCETYADGDNRFHWLDLAALSLHGQSLRLGIRVKQHQIRVVAANPALDSKETWWPYDSAPPGTHLDLELVHDPTNRGTGTATLRALRLQ